MALHLTGSNPIFRIVYSASSVHVISPNVTQVAVAYHKAQYEGRPGDCSMHEDHGQRSCYFRSLSSCVGRRADHMSADRKWLLPASESDDVGVQLLPDRVTQGREEDTCSTVCRQNSRQLLVHWKLSNAV